MAKITKRAVENFRGNQPGTVIRDTELKGFQARLNSDGSISYRVEYRAGPGRTAPVRRIVIGRHGSITPDAARKVASSILARARLGEDPANTLAAARRMPKLAEFADRFLRESNELATRQPEQARLRTRTVTNYVSYMKCHIRPVLGNVRIDKITKTDVSRLHTKIGETRSVTANRVIEFIGTLWRAAADQGHVLPENNPTARIRAFKEKKRERYLSPVELGRLGEALRDAETVGIPWDYEAGTPGTKHLPKSVEDRRDLLP